MKYKVGDHVRIKSLDWYNENKDEFGVVLIENGQYLFSASDTIWCGKIITIVDVCLDEYYTIVEDFGRHRWTDEMIECKVEEESKPEPKFKVGDKVLIKDINWYNKNKDEDGDISCGEFIFVSSMSKFCGKILTIDVDFEDGSYLMKEDIDGFVFTNEMFDTFAEEEVERLTGNLSNSLVNEFELPDGYIFKDENGNVINATKIVLEKKKKEYPKTFEECVHVLEGDSRMSLEQMNTFRKLIDARNAYWKIAGDEMGLGRSWEPDWNDTSIKYCLERDFDAIDKNVSNHKGRTFAFPTEEMRDAFKENFDPDIEICKELL